MTYKGYTIKRYKGLYAVTGGKFGTLGTATYYRDLKTAKKDIDREESKNPRLPVGKKVRVYAKRLRNGRIELYR